MSEIPGWAWEKAWNDAKDEANKDCDAALPTDDVPFVVVEWLDDLYDKARRVAGEGER